MALTNKRLNTVEHLGMVLHIRGTFRMDTSMDEVLIWNPILKTAFVEYICGDTWAEVDASEEVKAAYRQSIVDRQLECDRLNAENLLKSVRVGATVKVVRGRKISKGTVFVVHRIDDFGYGEVVILADGSYTYSKNVQVEFNGEFIEPVLPTNYTFFFQAV